MHGLTSTKLNINFIILWLSKVSGGVLAPSGVQTKDKVRVGVGYEPRVR